MMLVRECQPRTSGEPRVPLAGDMGGCSSTASGTVQSAGEYRLQVARHANATDELAAAMTAGTLTADELLGRYCTLAYAQTGSYQETARRLGIGNSPSTLCRRHLYRLRVRQDAEEPERVL